MVEPMTLMSLRSLSLNTCSPLCHVLPETSIDSTTNIFFSALVVESVFQFLRSASDVLSLCDTIARDHYPCIELLVLLNPLPNEVCVFGFLICWGFISFLLLLLQVFYIFWMCWTFHKSLETKFSIGTNTRCLPWLSAITSGPKPFLISCTVSASTHSQSWRASVWRQSILRGCRASALSRIVLTVLLKCSSSTWAIGWATGRKRLSDLPSIYGLL